VSRSEITAADRRPLPRGELAAYFAAHGYAVVFQDNRGRYGSEGVFVKYLSDGEDGFDTCAWIVRQPWCDGRICTMGLSYAAHTQAALWCLDAPGVVAQVLDSGGFANSWTGGIRQFGAFELKQATWAFKQAGLSPEAQADPVLKAALAAEDIRDWFTRLPWREGQSPLRHHGDYEAYLFEQWRHGAFDGFWRTVGIWAEGHYDRYVRAECVHMSSWFDPYPRTATGNYVGLKAAGRGDRLLCSPGEGLACPICENTRHDRCVPGMPVQSSPKRLPLGLRPRGTHVAQARQVVELFQRAIANPYAKMYLTDASKVKAVFPCQDEATETINLTSFPNKPSKHQGDHL
jgi:predicted acyl esterase